MERALFSRHTFRRCVRAHVGGLRRIEDGIRRRKIGVEVRARDMGVKREVDVEDVEAGDVWK